MVGLFKSETKVERMKKNIEKPNMTVEVFLSVLKWFGLFILLNNAIWFGVIHNMINGSSAEISQVQAGTNNYQELSNG